MAEQGYITVAQKVAAQAAPLVVTRDAVDASMNYMVNVARVQAERGGVNVRDQHEAVLTACLAGNTIGAWRPSPSRWSAGTWNG